MDNIKEGMPVLARHEGEWTGTYIFLDPDGNIIDKHHSHLTHQFPEDGSYSYYQINRYEWPDGKQEEHHFPGTYQDKKLFFDTERLEGYAWEVDDHIVILKFIYKEMPNIYLYEMIHLSSCGNYRNRTLHWFKDGQIFKRTLMKEERVR